MRRAATLAMLCAVAAAVPRAVAAPHVPADDAEVLAELPTGVRHAAVSAQALAASRIDVALPLAQFDISQARATGDLRFLGYAEALLAPWLRRQPVEPAVLVLDATILQSRHAFDASLAELDRALAQRPDDAQAWLTRATVLRVLGRYGDALQSCGHLSGIADPAIAALCRDSLRGLTGHLRDAYAALQSLPVLELPPAARAWRYSELGEMAARAGDDAAALRWLSAGLALAPQDFYMRAACADVLLRQRNPAQVLDLLKGYESMEPMLLRLAIAHRQLHDGEGGHVEALLAGAFQVEQQRGDAVHRREQARFLLDVAAEPAAALDAALANWSVQREPDDLLILLRAADAAHRPQAARDARQFLEQTGLEDARLAPYAGAS